MHVMSTLLTLNTDTLLQIVYCLLDPRDLLCLRMTCTALRDLTNERSVWQHALTLQCSDDPVATCVFVCEEMTTAQLERAVLRPYLFMSKLASSHPYRLRSRIIQFNLPSLSVGEIPGDAIECFRVLRGGRFIATGSRLGWVHVWDMGHHSSSQNPNIPVLCFSYHAGSRVEHVSAYALDRGVNSRYRIIAVCSTDTRDDSIKVFEVNLTAPTGSTEGVEERDSFLAERGGVYTWHSNAKNESDLLILAHPENILVRDMTKHTWGVVSLVLDEDLPSPQSVENIEGHNSGILVILKLEDHSQCQWRPYPAMFDTLAEANAASMSPAPIVYILPKSFTGCAFDYLGSGLSWGDTYMFKAQDDRAFLYTARTYKQKAGTDKLTPADDPNPASQSMPIVRKFLAFPDACRVPEHAMVVIVDKTFAIISPAPTDDEDTLHARVAKLDTTSTPPTWKTESEGKRIAWIGDVDPDTLAVDMWRGTLYFNTQTRAFGGELRAFDFVDGL